MINNNNDVYYFSSGDEASCDSFNKRNNIVNHKNIDNNTHQLSQKISHSSQFRTPDKHGYHLTIYMHYIIL